MSQYTREEILKMIEDNGGPEGLDLSGADLSGIDLCRKAIAKELRQYRKNNPDQTPPWFSQDTEGIDLRQANLEEADLSTAHLEGAYLRGAHLQGAHLEKAQFMGAHLQGAYLVEAHLERVNFERANLEEAHLLGAHLEGANLRHVHLESADLMWGQLKGAILWKARLDGAILREAHLEDAMLGEVHLEAADLVRAYLEGAILDGAHLERAFLVGAHLEKVDLSVAASLTGAYFYRAWLDQTRMTRDQLGDLIGEEIRESYYQAKEAYLLLKNNFNQIGRYDDASWAYIKERQMEKMTYHPKLAHQYYAKIEGLREGASPKSWSWWRFYLKYTLKWLWDWILELTCGYGEKPLKVAGVAVAAIFIFGLLYRLSGGIVSTQSQAVSWFDYLLYSGAAFATIDLPSFQATNHWSQFLTTLEAISGISLLALLMFTLGNRISRS